MSDFSDSFIKVGDLVKVKNWGKEYLGNADLLEEMYNHEMTLPSHYQDPKLLKYLIHYAYYNEDHEEVDWYHDDKIYKVLFEYGDCLLITENRDDDSFGKVYLIGITGVEKLSKLELELEKLSTEELMNLWIKLYEKKRK